MRLSLPSSIVLAGAIVALGLYFGLRASGPEAGASPQTSHDAGPAQAVVAPAPAPTAPQPAGPIPSDPQLRAEVMALVEGAKLRWKAACWDTADPATRKPGRYISVLAFDAIGGLDVSGVSEIRDGSDPVVAQCLRMQMNAFTITAPRRNVSFEIPFEIP